MGAGTPVSWSVPVRFSSFLFFGIKNHTFFWPGLVIEQSAVQWKRKNRKISCNLNNIGAFICRIQKSQYIASINSIFKVPINTDPKHF
jgi:hypothetical protein